MMVKDIEKEEFQTRLDYMDIFRGFGIILMIMGHIGFGDTFDYFIHAFHMPMFFFASGFFFSKKSPDKLKTADYIKRKCKALIVPYCFFGIFHFLILCMTQRTGEEWKSLVHLLFINTTGLPIAGALWFLTAIFFTNVIYFLLDRYILDNRLKTVLVIILSLFGNIAPKLLPFRLPYALDISFVGIGLFHIAYTLKQHMENKYIEKMFKLNKAIWFISAILMTVLIFVNGYINMRTGMYAIIPLFWINAIGACVVGINLSEYLEELKINGKSLLLIHFIKRIGKNSMVYLCLNQIVLIMIRNMIEPLGIPRGFLQIAILILGLIVLYVCDLFINGTKLRVVVGKMNS